MTLVIDSRVIIGTALGARSLMPVSTHAGEGTPRDGLPAGVAHVAVARLRGENVSASAALPGSTADARVATVPKRHVTSPRARARARARAQEERHRRAARLRRRERRRRVRPRRRRRDSRRRQRLGRGAARVPRRRPVAPRLVAVRRRLRGGRRDARRPRRARAGASHVRIAEETNRAPASSVHAAVPGSAASAVSPPRVSPAPREKERAPRPLGESRRLRGGGRDDEAPAAGVAGARARRRRPTRAPAYWKTAPLLVKSAAFMETSTSTKPFRPPPPPSRVATEARGGG